MFILEVAPGGINIAQAYEWSNGLFDVTWSESSPNVLVTGSGDGSLQAWHTNTPQVCSCKHVSPSIIFTMFTMYYII